MSTITLRDVEESDLPFFFQHQKDKIANHMAAFTSKDPNDWNLFYEHWSRILSDEGIIKKSITVDNHLVGHVSSFEQFGEREVSYWIDRDQWGRGIATNALQQLLTLVTTRPLYARAAKDNIGSRRVLEKSGFVITDESSGYANARHADVEEFVFTLFT